MRSGCQRFGFSLVEVVVAVGIFAVAVTGVLGFLPMLARESAEARDALVAGRLPASLRSELIRLTMTGGFDALTAAVPSLNSSAETGMGFVASRDGSVLASESAPSVAIPADGQYFRLEVWRFSAAPLAFDPAGGVLALYVRVSWPYRLPGSTTPTEAQHRSEIGWTLALSR